jgi:hypothetical protein
MALLDGKQIRDGSITNAKLATPAGNAVSSNKGMTASVTSADFNEACATALVSAPASHSYITVKVNGVAQELGDGIKTKDCYFSADSGATARAFSAIAAGDKLYWVGTVAGFQLAVTDKISFYYEA